MLRHERGVLVGAILLLATLSWIFVLNKVGMHSMQPPFFALILMWCVMMVAMMLPSAVPAILLYAQVRWSRGDDPAIVQPWVFVAGYLIMWLLFSVVAASVQSLLPGQSMGLQSRIAQGILLIGAGAYQLSPLKSACISQCRSPAQFISRHWRSGPAGALRLGMLHGAYCVGCCWVLMALLFVGGMMNVLWVIGLTMLVTAEKLLPGQLLLQRTSGAVLIAWGALRILG